MAKLAYKSGSNLNPDIGSCLSSLYHNDAAKLAVGLTLVFLVILPLFIITISNIVLCVIAYRCAKRVETRTYKALLTVCSLSGLFIVSWLPFISFTILKMVAPDLSAAAVTFDSACLYCLFVNSFGNPVLYSLTNRRFGDYVKGMLAGMFCRRSRHDALLAKNGRVLVPRHGSVNDNAKNYRKMVQQGN